jgi:hypothetical protein
LDTGGGTVLARVSGERDRVGGGGRSYRCPRSPRRACPREEARDAARRGRTPSPARVRPEEGDDGRDPLISETGWRRRMRAALGRREMLGR